ncbi:hypothetical protein V6R21_19540 [Limibacter armeniacum]|uniref:hypothetical protein n=1 Tax=Limibacter armeniacum TaxID=466084 RepID=UPI002FE5E619
MNPKYLIKLAMVLFVTLTASISLKAQVGQAFPNISVTDLNDKNLTLPSAARGKVTLIGVAYSKQSDDKLNTWVQPFYNTFLSAPSSGTMFVPEQTYDVNLYFLGMINGVARTAGENVRSRMKKNIMKDLHDNTVTYKGNIKTYKEKLSLGKKDDPYLYVLDSRGKVVYMTYGAYSSSKMREIENAVEKHSK